MFHIEFQQYIHFKFYPPKFYEYNQGIDYEKH